MNTITVKLYSLEYDAANKTLTLISQRGHDLTYTDFGIPELWDAYTTMLSDIQKAYALA